MQVIKKIKLIISISLLFTICSYAEETLLVGREQIGRDGGARFHATAWKAYRDRAIDTGSAEKMCVYIWDYDADNSGNRTNDSIGYAVYEDNSGSVGDLKVWGQTNEYNWAFNGGDETWHCFTLQNVESGKDRIITFGQYYWTVFFVSGGEDIKLARLPGDCGGTTKIGAAHAQTSPPPVPSDYNAVYADNCYGWGVWTEEDESGNNFPPSAPTGLRIISDQ